MIRLNLGSGQHNLSGFINVDKFPEGKPNVVFDLETTPWPWDDNSVELVMMNHSLEHMGRNPDVFFGIIKELYRVCKPGGEVEIRVPHPRHDAYLCDPTHVRPITPEIMLLFSKAKNREWKEQQKSNTPLALYLDVDFQLVENCVSLDDPYKAQFESGALSQAELERALKTHNNVAVEIQLLLRAVK